MSQGTPAAIIAKFGDIRYWLQGDAPGKLWSPKDTGSQPPSPSTDAPPSGSTARSLDTSVAPSAAGTVLEEDRDDEYGDEWFDPLFKAVLGISPAGTMTPDAAGTGAASSQQSMLPGQLTPFSDYGRSPLAGGGGPNVSVIDIDEMERELTSMATAEAAMRVAATEGCTGANQEIDNELLMLEAGKSKGFGVRTTMGVRFSRDAKGGKSAAYHAMSSHADKADFRMKWAALQFEEYQSRKVKTQSWSEIDVKLGTYLPLSLIFWEEGQRGIAKLQDEQAVTAGLRHAAMCAKMGGKYVSFNDVTGRYEYLHFRRQVRDEFKKKWSQYVEERSAWISRRPDGGGQAATPTPAAASSVPVPTATEITPAAAKKAAATAAAAAKKAAALEEAADETPSSLKRARTTLDTAIAEASKVKSLYQVTSSTSGNLLKAMDQDASWSWATPAAKAGLKAPLVTAAGVLDAAFTPFARRFLVTDIKELKKAVGAATLEIELIKFGQLAVQIEAVKLEAQILGDMVINRDATLKRHSTPVPTKIQKARK